MTTTPVPEDLEGLERLLDFLKRSRGFDFTGYKRSSLQRRTEKRMQSVGVARFDEYVDYLEVHPEEFPQLFNTILINVTAFFRDPASWEVLRKDVLPEMLARNPREPIRAWSAGAASGQEAYSLAMVLAEALGPKEFVRRVKIYATDLDEDALAYARAATFSAKEVGAVPPELLARYFEKSANRFSFHKELRRAVIFGRHDLIQDAPISRIDLITCRNTVMYFNAETQTRILARLHFALNDGGVIFLGKAEMLLTHAHLFTPIDLKRRIFSRVARGSRDRLLLLAQNGTVAAPIEAHLGSNPRLRDNAFDAGATPQIIIDAEGTLALANDLARSLFNLSPRDLGRPLQDLEVSYRPVELRSCIEQATTERRVVELKEVPRGPGADIYLDIQVSPLFDGASLLGTVISFNDVTSYKRLQSDLRSAHGELEAAYEELQSTSEELETTNEELQSTVEELETTNEELQSTNEELETMNEELQSSNEELQTMNDEVVTRSSDLNQANEFLSSILTGLRAGVIVLDRELDVIVWNKKSADLWGLRAEEVEGKSFLNLDIGLPVQELRTVVWSCLSGELDDQQVTVKARNRRGRSIQCTVTCTPLRTGTTPRGVILLVEDSEEARPKT
jgi:two-component system CheB/CheR fusion protein